MKHIQYECCCGAVLCKFGRFYRCPQCGGVYRELPEVVCIKPGAAPDPGVAAQGGHWAIRRVVEDSPCGSQDS